MNKYLDLSPEVAEAVRAGKPVVALASNIQLVLNNARLAARTAALL